MSALAFPRRVTSYIYRKPEALRRSRMNANWGNQNYILDHLHEASPQFYEGNKHIVELEHQVGRYLNMQNIAWEIASEGLTGDIIEFGTWQGMGLILLSHVFAADKMPRKFIGIDSFEGLPESSTIWEKGTFNNTSKEVAKNNILHRKYNNPAVSVDLIQGYFSDPAVPQSLHSISESVALVHFDADLASSTTQALAIIEPYIVGRTKPIYFLFDDWGCHPDEVPDAFYAWLETKKNIRAEKKSSTRYTRYYKIHFI